MDEAIRAQIVTNFHLADMERADQDHYIDIIGGLLFQEVIRHAIEALDGNDALLDELDQLADTVGDDYTRILDFLKKHVPDYDKIFAEQTKRLADMSASIFAPAVK